MHYSTILMAVLQAHLSVTAHSKELNLLKVKTLLTMTSLSMSLLESGIADVDSMEVVFSSYVSSDITLPGYSHPPDYPL